MTSPSGSSPRFLSVALPLVLLTLLPANCTPRGSFHCQEKDQCGTDGFCESTGACSIKDDTCESGRRYRDHAPDPLADRCVSDACPQNPVVGLRAGGDHACLWRQDGTVWCWGQGASGELGDGTAVARSTVQTVPGLAAPVSALALGAAHTCAVVPVAGAAFGGVWCWGANESGQLGDGTTQSRPAPAPVPGIDDAIDIVAGGAFTCALRAAHTLSCWGDDANGEIGLGTNGPAVLSPMPVPGLEDVQRMAAADRHVCAVTATGAVFCWGSNSQGELGDGTTSDRATPTRVVGLPDGDPHPTVLAAGVAHTCAIAGGQVFCWGANQLGERGDGSDDATADLAPSMVSALAGVTDLAAAGHHTCAVEQNGSAWCWGANQAGQLGEGTTTSIGVPVPVTQLGDAVSIATGDTFSCARRRDGAIWCWGDDRLGQLGTGARLDRLVPTEVAALTEASSLATGAAHTCALAVVPGAPGARLSCWGANQAGQLGDGTRVDRGVAAPLKIALDVREVVAGALHTCVGTTDGAVWCWGRGSRGQLGAALLIDYVVPVAAGGLANVTHLGAGGAHTCAVRAGGVACWGANDDGQLGGGTFDKAAGAVGVAGLGDDIAQLALGAAHTCARRDDGRVTCWGRGTEGQLGDGRLTTSPTPVEVVGIADAVGIAAGDSHTCAVSRAGDVWCWGAGSSGELGSGSGGSSSAGPTIRPAPGAVIDLREVVEIAAGSHHTCARTVTGADARAPGELRCWGANDQGQLGDGTRDGRVTPAATSILSDAVAVSAGGNHTCAIRAGGKLACFGEDTSGQLGNGRVLQFTTAQPAHITCP